MIYIIHMIQASVRNGDQPFPFRKIGYSFLNTILQ